MPPSLPSGRVTLAFTDVVDSTRILASHGDAYVRALLRVHRRVTELTTRHGGVVVKSTGDGAFLVFESAAAAVACLRDIAAFDAQQDGEPRLSLRSGAHAGEAVAIDGDYIALAVHVAARVTAAARAGQVLVSQAVIDDLPAPCGEFVGEYLMRGLEAPLSLWRIAGSPERPAAQPVRRTNVARPRTSFLGRDADVRAVQQLLETADCVTIVGPGGVGKTRLASEVALADSAARGSGAWLVALDEVHGPDEVVAAVAAVLDVRGAPSLDTVVAELQSRDDALLILDNCEHVIDAVALLVGNVRARCPAIRLLATSREPLLVPGECVRRLAPLPTEQGAAAEQLFRERAAAAGVVVDDGEDAAIGEICRALDGLPLALELAAARAGEMSIPELSADIADRRMRLFRRGGAPRQRTLDALVAWSYDRLPAADQRSLLALSVLPAGFRPETVSGFLGRVPGAAHDAGGRLAQRSLLDVDGERLRMLVPVRNVVRDLLADEPDFEAEVGRALAEWALTVIEARNLVRVIDDGFDDDLYLAFEEAFARTYASGIAGRGLLLRVLYWWAAERRLTVRLATLGRQFAADPIPVEKGDDAVLMSAALRATLGWAVSGAAGVRWPAEQVLELAARVRVLCDPEQARYCLSVLGGYCVANGEATTGRELLIETIELIDAHPELAHWRMAVIGTLGIAHHLAGDLDQAEACYREQMERAEQAADSSELTIGANNLAELLLDTGEAAAAVDLLKPRVQDSRIGENPYVVSLTLLAEALFRSERPDEARALVPEARRRLEGLLAADPGMQMYLDRLHAAAAGR